MKKITFFIIISGLVIYALTLKAIPGNITSSSPQLALRDSSVAPFELSGSRSAFATLLALNERGTFDLGLELANIATPDTGFYKGKIYSYFPPGVALIGLPFYKLGEYFNLSQAFAYFSISILAVISLILIFRISKEIFNLPVWTSFFVVILSGFGTHFFNYSITFYQQIPITFLALLSFYSVWKYKQQGKFSWIWAATVWTCYGVGPFINYPNLILYLPIMIYFLFTAVSINSDPNGFRIKFKRYFLITSVILILLASLQIYYNYRNFGNIKRFSNTLAQYNPTLKGKTYDELMKKDVETIVESKGKIASIFKEQQIVNGLYALLFDLDKSMLMHNPFFLISILSIFLLRKRLSWEISTIIALLVVNLLVYASFGDPWGGWSFGPRYLVLSVPFLAMLFGYWLARPGALLLKKILALELFIYGAGVALLGVLGRNITIPKVEAIPLKLPSTYLSAIEYINNDQNGTFFFNTYLYNRINLWQYYFILLGLLTLLACFSLFILPKFEKSIFPINETRNNFQPEIKPVLHKKKKNISKKRRYLVKW